MTAPLAPLDQAIAALRADDMPLCQALTATMLREQPENDCALALRGASVVGDEARAFALIAAACRRGSTNAQHWYLLGRWYEQRTAFRDAAYAYRRALLLDPQHSDALVRGTEMLRVTEHFAETIPLAQRLQHAFPDSPVGFAHEAIARQHLRELERADALFEAAIARSQSPALLHWEHHFSLLMRHRFGEAWDCYEHRFACGEANGVDDMAFDLPRWDGTPDRHVLVYGEQGLGDQIMFASALPDVLACSRRVTLVVAPTLVAVMRASFPDIQVLPITQKLDPAVCAGVAAQAGADIPVDAVIPLGSLMALFRRERSAFPGTPYLRASDDSRAFWNDAPRHLQAVSDSSPTKKLRIGLCWSCNPVPERFSMAQRAAHRMIPVNQIARLSRRPDVDAVAITNISLDRFGIKDPDALGIADVSTSLTSIDRTAALLERLDLLITVDTGVAHLAGALGVPVWVMLHKAGDPRWSAHNTPDSYWYDSARLYWQAAAGDWAELVDRIERQLEGELAKQPGKAVA